MKKKQPNIIVDGKDVLALNRAARRKLKKLGIPHIYEPYAPIMVANKKRKDRHKTVYLRESGHQFEVVHAKS